MGKMLASHKPHNVLISDLIKNYQNPSRTQETQQTRVNDWNKCFTEAALQKASKNMKGLDTSSTECRHTQGKNWDK